ncbi:MAG: hypothetical protein HQK85_08560 [Nitrospinae bacterium]|nr:hypothetical protein [Nitrospinota bacterium]
MCLIIHHRALGYVFRFSLALFTAVFLLAPSATQAQDRSSASAGGIVEIIDILKKEIARDEEVTSSSMNMTRLRQTREKLAGDLGRKGKALSALKAVKHPAIESAIQVVEETYIAETTIIADTRINEAVQIRATRALRENLPKKKQALADLENWLGTKLH